MHRSLISSAPSVLENRNRQSFRRTSWHIKCGSFTSVPIIVFLQHFHTASSAKDGPRYLTLTFDEDQTGSKSGELVVIDDEFATLATATTALVADARSAAISATATTAASATAASAFNEIIVVLASLEAKEIGRAHV